MECGLYDSLSFKHDLICRFRQCLWAWGSRLRACLICLLLAMCATQCLLDALLRLLRVFPVLRASGLRVYGVFGRVIYTRCLGCGWIEMGGSRRAEDFEEELVVTTLVFQV